jgi:hypothetical protein
MSGGPFESQVAARLEMHTMSARLLNLIVSINSLERNMRVGSALLSILAWSVIHAPAAQAQESDVAPGPRFEVTPFVGWQSGGHFDTEESSDDADVNGHASFALSIGMGTNEESQYELFYSRQSTTLDSNAGLDHADLDVDYLHLSGTAVYDNPHAWKPYVVGSFGVTRLTLGVPEASDRSRFSLSVGGGLRIPLQPRIALRFEARVYLTFLDTGFGFCRSGSSGAECAALGDSTFVQYALLAGAAFRF